MGAVVAPDVGLSELFDAEVGGLYGFVLARCGNREVAHDVVSETFVAATALFAADRGAEVSPAWLRTVARRRLIDHWRTVRSIRRKCDRLTSASRGVTDQPADSDGRAEAALNTLGERYRAVLVLRYVDDYPVGDVADALGLSYKATESLLGRAKKAFSAAYEETP